MCNPSISIVIDFSTNGNERAVETFARKAVRIGIAAINFYNRSPKNFDQNVLLNNYGINMILRINLQIDKMKTEKILYLFLFLGEINSKDGDRKKIDV